MLTMKRHAGLTTKILIVFVVARLILASVSTSVSGCRLVWTKVE